MPNDAPSFPRRKVFHAFLLTIASIAPAFSAEPAVSTSAVAAPVFVADLPNPNDFTLFANAGWDGNWYVGYNNCWIQKLTVPPGKYARAFVGARLGRMKNATVAGRPPWEKKAYPAEIYAAIASTPSWNRKQSYFLAAGEEIPLEPDPENAVESVGESQWFWKEVPLEQVNLNGDNYIAVWSPTEKVVSASSAPILAAGWGTKDVDSWLVSDIKGQPPSSPAKALSTPITVFEPAIALKLIPENASLEKPKVMITQFLDGKPRGKSPAPKVVGAQVSGVSIERAWVEISTNEKDWKKFGLAQWKAPFVFSLKAEDLPVGPNGKTWARIAAADAFENVGVSSPISLFERKGP